MITTLMEITTTTGIIILITDITIITISIIITIEEDLTKEIISITK
jgi:hypothetical protein